MNKYSFLFLCLVFIYGTAWAINPMKEYKMKPDKFGIEYEELEINTTDGHQLNTWIMNSPVDTKRNHTIIIVGSDSGNMGFSLPYASYLLRAGYDVITFDYRGFGGSSAFDFNPNNLYHSEYVHDFTCIMDWVNTNYKQQKIGVLAFSMGTLIATIGYSKSHYDFFIGEGFVLSPEKIVQRVKQLKGKNLVLPESADSDAKKINTLDIPMILFASSADQTTTLEDSLTIARQANNRKVVEFDGEHLRGAATLGLEEYVKNITEFIHSI
jgi:alpha-beta hydrolase superfamily lysophospholipase